jgi:signal peptide peptidase SppA
MRHAILIAEFLATPWALMPERLSAFAGILARWSQGQPRAMDDAELAESREVRAARRQQAARAGGGQIAVLPLYGVVTQRGNMVDDVSGPGSCSTQIFSSALREVMADDTVGAVLIDIDSPGGSVYGVGELADEILAARAKKPVVAIANSLAASAAYWIGCSASELYVTPGGEVGSIGVWSAHQDLSKHLEDLGVKTTLISAGKNKVEGNPYEPLSSDARDFQQSRVNDYYGAFTKAVARGRNVPISQVRDGMGQGRVLGADQALAEKMVDGVSTLDDVLKRMSRNLQASRAAGRSGSARADRDLDVLA